MPIGDRIRRKRNSHDMSQRKLGRLVGVTGQAVSQWETGSTQSLEGENLVRLAAALQVTTTWLLYGTDDSVNDDDGRYIVQYNNKIPAQLIPLFDGLCALANSGHLSDKIISALRNLLDAISADRA